MTLREAAPALPTLTLTGRTSAERAKFCIFRGIVAEKRSVCRCPQKCEMIVRTSSSKPMSTMRSASSRTCKAVRERGLQRAAGRQALSGQRATSGAHEEATELQREELLLEQVHEAARSGHHYVHAALDLLELVASRHAAREQ